ncbi:MAG: TetR/AcrR family transcriptional regulator [Myxococcota bacterium]
MEALDTSPAAARRPVQARSQRTRARLLGACIDVLAQSGYAGATTTAIADAAAVSQGALYKHFPSKLDLLEAALFQVLADARAHFATAFARDRDARTDAAGAVFRHLWDVFTSPQLQAAFELYLAARTDPDLALRVVPIIEHHRSEIIEGAKELFPDTAREHENYAGAVNALISTLQGAAMVSALLPPENTFVETQRRSIERMIRTEFARRTP